VAWPKAGYVLDRSVFDAALARMAEEAGATLLLRTPATGVTFTDGRIEGVAIRQGRAVTDIQARMVIAADGVTSKLGRWAGVDAAVPERDLHLCAQYLLEHPSFDSHRAEFHLGRQIAPGGYAWVFPKGPGLANVGVGVVASLRGGRSPRDYLDAFARRRAPGARCMVRMAGGTPANNAPFPLVRDNFMLVGDAGRLTDPLSGAGIAIAMGSGRMAAEVAIEAMRSGDTARADAL
jgi:digeranylgeranylglycerophospholipid reductase